MRFTEANINKIKDNLCVGKLFTLPLHQDMKHCPCQSFRALKVACKQDLPSTWLKYFSCIIMGCIFLVAAYDLAWRGSGLTVFSLCWSLMLSSTAISQCLREAELINVASLPLQKLSWALPMGSMIMVTRESKWHVGVQNAQASTASPERKLLTIALLSCTCNEVKIYSKTAAHVHSGALENKVGWQRVWENFHLWFLRL